MAKIHIQFTLFSAFYSPLISTMTGNFLSEEGFDYEWSVAEPGVSALEALSAGTAQVVQSTISQGFSSLEKGDPPTARHFALINNMDGFFITGRDRDDNFNWAQLKLSSRSRPVMKNPSILLISAKCRAVGGSPFSKDEKPWLIVDCTTWAVPAESASSADTPGSATLHS